MSLFRIALIALLATQLYGCAAAPALMAGAAGSGVMAAHDRRTPGTVIDDQAIETKAFFRLAKSDTLSRPEDAHVNTTSFNGILLLTGEVRTAELRRQAEEHVSDIPKVRKVHNEIQVSEPSTLRTRTRDSWLTAKVKTRLLANEAIDGTRIKVVTEGGTVYLMGMVTRDESALATSIVSDTEGVKRIVRTFEYLD